MTQKIAIISLTNIYLSPYILNYIDVAKEKGIQTDIIYWDRHALSETLEYEKKVKLISFKEPMSEESSKFFKLRKYFRFRKFAKKKLKRNKYSKVVFLQTSGAILLTFFLKNQYKYNYLVDIRDYTLENNYFFKILETILVKNSGLNIISSNYYKEFLPKSNYILCHNCTKIENVQKQIDINKRHINIYYIGLVRFDDRIKWFINEIKNHPTISFYIVGKGASRFQDFISINNINNVFLEDYFDPKDTEIIFNKADIIYNLYGYDTPLLDYALSNKLYYAAQLKKPILSFEGTAMDEISKNYNFGITVSRSKNIGFIEDIINDFRRININELEIGTERFIQKVEQDNRYFRKQISRFYSQ